MVFLWSIKEVIPKVFFITLLNHNARLFFPTTRANAAMVLRRKPNDKVRDHSSCVSRSEDLKYQEKFKKFMKGKSHVRSIPIHLFQPILAQFPFSISDRTMPKKPSTKKLNIADIHLEWDGDADLRQRLLDGGSVMAPGPCCEDISTCLKNRALLAPILTRMASHESRKVPPIDSLVDEVVLLLGRAKRGPEMDKQSDAISKTSSAIKKLCGFVKMKCRRREVSTVTGTQICRI